MKRGLTFLEGNLQIDVHAFSTRSRRHGRSGLFLACTGGRLDLGADDQIADVLFRPGGGAASELVVSRLDSTFVLARQLKSQQ